MQKIRIAVIGVGTRPGKTFVKDGLWHFLKNKNRFITREEKYEIVESPEHPEDFDIIVGVIDPYPDTVKEGLDVYAKFNEPAWDTLWIVNKLNPGVNLRELEWFLKRKFSFTQEYIDPAMVYSSAYLKVDLYSEDEEKFSGIQRLAREIERRSVNFL